MDNSTPTGYVYLIQAETLGRVKIGYSTSPQSRLRALRTASPVPLTLVTIWPGSQQDEKAIHAILANHNLHLEWFELAVDAAIKAIDDYLASPRQARAKKEALVNRIDIYAELGDSEWNIETYKDRHGKRRARYYSRFMDRPIRKELGVVTPEIEQLLKQRKGRGRWRSSRLESARFKQRTP